MSGSQKATIRHVISIGGDGHFPCVLSSVRRDCHNLVTDPAPQAEAFEPKKKPVERRVRRK
jgi:hypothetical protein